MDRPFWWYGATLRDTDLLNASRFPMVGLGKLAEAMLGLSTAVAGFTLSPTAPASLSATLGPGQVYEAENLEASQWAAFAPDTHTLVKQGIALDPQTLTFVPPTTVGYAQNFLVEVQYVDIDGGATVLPYYNAANPAVPYSGPGNAGTAQSTVRQGAVAVQIKAGVAATSGTQVSPAPDAGWAPLFVVTLASGQTTVTSGNITQYATAPFIPLTLPQIPAAIQAQGGNGAPDTGTANAMVISLPSYTPGTLPDYTPVRFKKGASANTGATTITINGTVYAVQTASGSALTGGELPANATGAGIILGGALRLSNGATAQSLAATSGGQSWTSAGTYSFTVPAGIYSVDAEVWGAGGGGGGAANAGSSSGAGAGGGYVRGKIPVTPGQVLTVVVGAAGAGGGGAANGSAGGSSSVGSLTATGGGPGAYANGFIVTGTPAQGGTGSGGTFAVTGGIGGLGLIAGTSTNVLSSPGGGTFQTSNTGTFGQNANGTTGYFPGGGGSGCASTNAGSSFAGGNGAPGCVKLTWGI